MSKPKRSPDALNALYGNYVEMLKSGKPQLEVELALNLPDKYAKKFLKQAGEEGLWKDVLGKAEYQICFGKTTLSELAEIMLGKASNHLGKTQVWKVRKCENGCLKLEPHQVEAYMPQAEAKTISPQISQNQMQISTREG